MDGSEPHSMRRVDHYDRTRVVMPNGATMYSYTPVFESEVTGSCSSNSGVNSLPA